MPSHLCWSAAAVVHMIQKYSRKKKEAKLHYNQPGSQSDFLEIGDLVSTLR
jgi:hypothetical protein